MFKKLLAFTLAVILPTLLVAGTHVPSGGGAWPPAGTPVDFLDGNDAVGGSVPTSGAADPTNGLTPCTVVNELYINTVTGREFRCTDAGAENWAVINYGDDAVDGAVERNEVLVPTVATSDPIDFVTGCTYVGERIYNSNNQTTWTCSNATTELWDRVGGSAGVDAYVDFTGMTALQAEQAMAASLRPFLVFGATAAADCTASGAPYGCCTGVGTGCVGNPGDSNRNVIWTGTLTASFANAKTYGTSNLTAKTPLLAPVGALDGNSLPAIDCTRNVDSGFLNITLANLNISVDNTGQNKLWHLFTTSAQDVCGFTSATTTDVTTTGRIASWVSIAGRATINGDSDNVGTWQERRVPALVAQTGHSTGTIVHFGGFGSTALNFSGLDLQINCGGSDDNDNVGIGFQNAFTSVFGNVRSSSCGVGFEQAGGGGYRLNSNLYLGTNDIGFAMMNDLCGGKICAASDCVNAGTGGSCAGARPTGIAWENADGTVIDSPMVEGNEVNWVLHGGITMSNLYTHATNTGGNHQCTGVGAPYSCCTGAGTGACNEGQMILGAGVRTDTKEVCCYDPAGAPECESLDDNNLDFWTDIYPDTYLNGGGVNIASMDICFGPGMHLKRDEVAQVTIVGSAGGSFAQILGGNWGADNCTASGQPWNCCTGAGTGPLCGAPTVMAQSYIDSGRGLSSQNMVPPSNAFCTASEKPMLCCTGAGTGDCDYQGRWIDLDMNSRSGLTFPADASCSGDGSPHTCCTGAGAGQCDERRMVGEHFFLLDGVISGSGTSAVCDSGGTGTNVLCRWNGTVWQPAALGGGGSAGITNEAFGGTWASDTTNGAARANIYAWGNTFDNDNDGLVNNLDTGAVDAIGEIASGIKSGGGTTLATVATEGGANEMCVYDVDGDVTEVNGLTLVCSGTTCTFDFANGSDVTFAFANSGAGGSSVSSDPSATPTGTYDDTVDADGSPEARIVCDANAADNGKCEVQVEEADGTYASPLFGQSVGGVVSGRVGIAAGPNLVCTESGNCVYSGHILTLPWIANPTTDADGEIAFDEDGWGTGHDALRWWDGTEAVEAVAIRVGDACLTGQRPDLNADGSWGCADDATGSFTAHQQCETIDAWAVNVDGVQCTLGTTSVRIGSGPLVPDLQCADNATGEIQFTIAMGQNWDIDDVDDDVVIKMRSAWTQAAPSGNLVLDCTSQCRGDSDAMNSTFGGSDDLTTTYDTQNDEEFASVATIDPGTCAKGDSLTVRCLVNTSTSAAAPETNIQILGFEFCKTVDGFDEH